MQEGKSNGFKDYLQDHGVPLVAVAKAGDMHNARMSQIANLWVKPSGLDVQRLKMAFGRLGLDPRQVDKLSKHYESSLPNQQVTAPISRNFKRPATQSV